MKGVIHKDFKLQGINFNSIDALLSYSNSLSKDLCIFLTEWFNAKDFIEVYTSGSTGKPKKIQLLKTNMKQSALSTGEFFNLYEKTTALLCMSVNFIAGKMMLVRALELGWHLDFIEATARPLESLDKTYDFCAMVPLQLYNSIDKLDNIQQLIVGGGKVSKKYLPLIQQIGADIYETYGMTETITHIAVKKLNNLKGAGNFENANFRTLPQVVISKDEKNCLLIEAPWIQNGTLVTHDVVEIKSSTNFQWLGRYDTIINSGGVKLIPEQIEQKIESIIENRCFVYGISDDMLGQKLVLIIENSEVNLSSKKIMNKLLVSNLFHKYEFPKEIYFVERFIETATSKIDRNATVKLIKNIY